MSQTLHVAIDIDDTFCSTNALTCPFFRGNILDDYRCDIFGVIEPNKSRHKDCFKFNNELLHYQIEQDYHLKNPSIRVSKGSNMQFMEHSSTIDSYESNKD